MVRKLKIVLLLLLSCASLSSCKEDPIFPGYKVEEFTFQGHTAKVVLPNIESTGNWIWRARFWGTEPQLEKALLEKGFHVVYIDVADLFGNQKAVQLWNDFYKHCRMTYGLHQKVVLEGMSRGGLIVYNWASENTDKVACIYADAPVCDIKSWPGGFYNGVGSDKAWETCLAAHDLDEKSVLDFMNIPLNTAIKVAEAGIPALHVCGDSDKVVPYEENTALLIKNFKEYGGEIDVILKKGIGHHPHSLENPKPIVEFIMQHTPNLK